MVPKIGTLEDNWRCSLAVNHTTYYWRKRTEQSLSKIEGLASEEIDQMSGCTLT